MRDLPLARPTTTPWLEPESHWPAMARATEHLDPPFGAISLPALAWNAHDLLDRAKGLPIRVASKSIRVRSVMAAVLALPGYRGVLAYSLPEALWLAEQFDDVVVGYPTTHRAALARLAASPELAARVTLMIDSVDQLDAVDAAAAPAGRQTVRVAIELDVSWEAHIVGHVGAWRSPVRTPDDARALAEAIVRRPGFALVGLMGYESQIAGVVDDISGRAAMSAVLRAAKKRSIPELAERRALAVAAVRGVADLEFVNGGGTGSLESTTADSAVTEVAAGSGLFGPHLFDNYRSFTPAPAAAFALEVVRKPRPDLATLLGGGWIASGMSGPDRAPLPVWPADLGLIAREMAGEVQTPLRGAGARDLAVGDRVWLRHTKAGELSEHLDAFALVDGDRVVDTVPTYRGEGRTFL